MLDIKTLNQLKELKQHIHDSIQRGTGIVKGTQKRFGFVIADEDGEEYLVPQEEMDRVLPGDHIQFVLEKGKKEDDKPIAKIEKLLSSEFSRFIGTVTSKKEQMFVVPDHRQCNRWIFIPPKFRKNLKEGDLVAAKISQHPFQHAGRVQAEITDVIGQPSDPYIEHRYAIVKEGIPEKIWQADELQAIRQTAETLLDKSIPLRTDLRQLPFFTIDGASTQDLDDALHIEATSNGWILQVAIADVASFVDEHSPLDRLSARVASSIYLPAQKIPMLPDVLSSDICSLKAHQDRLAMICRLDINQEGEIIHNSYFEASINSKAKLSYDDAAQFLDGKTSLINETIKAQLTELQKLARVRQTWRKKHALLMDEYVDYRFTMNDKGKITAIERQERNCAQQLVEECMLACNEATAAFLHKHRQDGLYLAHTGFKPDQIPGIEKLLDQYLPDFDKAAINTLDGYRHLLHTIEQLQCELPLKEILRKKLVRSEWNSDCLPHFGLGLPAYTTFTSPIRKYSDLLVHRMIKGILQEENSPRLAEKTLTQLNTALQAVRNAQNDCEMSLKCQFLQAFKGEPLEGEISMINHRVIGVYLPRFDVHGKIEVRSLNTPFTFRQDSLQLLSDTLNFKLKQQVSVAIDSIDEAQRYIKLNLLAPEQASSHESGNTKHE